MPVQASNYVSPEALTVWLAEKQNEVYGDMRAAMDMSERRSAMQDELSTIQRKLKEANESWNFAEVRALLEDFLDQYADAPEFESVTAAVADIHAAVEAKYDAPPPQYWEGTTFLPDQTEESIKDMAGELGLPILFQFTASAIDGWCQDLKAKGDHLSQQDQLAMITIQELNAKVNQSEQLVSNLLASKNQTENSVIANIRA